MRPDELTAGQAADIDALGFFLDDCDVILIAPLKAVYSTEKEVEEPEWQEGGNYERYVKVMRTLWQPEDYEIDRLLGTWRDVKWTRGVFGGSMRAVALAYH